MRAILITIAVLLPVGISYAQADSQSELRLKSNHRTYTWNGHTLRSKYSAQPRSTWTFDGKLLRSTFPTASTRSFRSIQGFFRANYGDTEALANRNRLACCRL